MLNEDNVKYMSCWAECLNFFETVRSDYNSEERDGEYVSPMLFRGHANSKWMLETTLDRFLSNLGRSEINMTIRDYYQIIMAVYPAFASHTGLNFILPSPTTSAYDEEFRRAPLQMPGYEFAIHLRHHGFPSPLLDWTRSPYVASFFAFNKTSIDGMVSIYCFIEDTGGGKESCSDKPRINGHGPYCITHDRHYRQQAEYTTCTMGFDEEPRYARHEDVYFGEEQDLLYKVNLPSSERSKVMKSLDQMNINGFSLFGSQEGLADMLAYREIECRC